MMWQTCGQSVQIVCRYISEQIGTQEYLTLKYKSIAICSQINHHRYGFQERLVDASQQIIVQIPWTQNQINEILTMSETNKYISINCCPFLNGEPDIEVSLLKDMRLERKRYLNAHNTKDQEWLTEIICWCLHSRTIQVEEKLFYCKTGPSKVDPQMNINSLY